MSELAKFVAATLKERVAVDLEEENNQLQKKNERLEAERTKALEYASRNGKIEITGKGGSPVYAHGEMSSAEYDDVNRQYDIKLTSEDPTICPVKKVKDAEIRLNGLLVAIVSECDVAEALEGQVTYTFVPENRGVISYTFYPPHAVGGFWNEKGLFLDVEFGPLPDPSLSTFNIDTDFRDEEIRELRFWNIVLGCGDGPANY